MCQNMQMRRMVNEAERFAKDNKEKRDAIDSLCLPDRETAQGTWRDKVPAPENSLMDGF